MSSTPPLRIALLGYRSHPYVGGQGVYLKYLSRALVAMGHHVEVISGQPYPDLDAGIPLIKLPSLDLYSYPNPATAVRWRDLKSFTDIAEYAITLAGGFAEPYTFGRRVLAYLRQRPGAYDVVHDNQSLSYGLLALEKLGIPIVTTVHHPITRDKAIAINAASTWLAKWGAKRWYGFTKMQVKVAQKLKWMTTVSSSSQRDIALQFKREAARTPVIYNGIDTALFTPDATIIPLADRIITTASSDQPIKGLPILLTAFSQVLRKRPRARLIIIGKLLPEGATDKLLNQLAIRDQVTFISEINHQELVREYCLSTVAVTPSLYEGFGLPAGEAMSCGVPVVSSDGGALPEVVGDAGLLVPAGDATALGDAIVRVLEDPVLAQQLAHAGRARILQYFSWSKVAADLTAFYYQALNYPRQQDLPHTKEYPYINNQDAEARLSDINSVANSRAQNSAPASHISSHAHR